MNAYCIIETTTQSNPADKFTVCLGVIHSRDTATRLVNALRKANDTDRQQEICRWQRNYEVVPMAGNDPTLD